MPNVRNLPVGTIGWTGSTMRENLQEDIFLPCDDRLVAVNVGPDGTYGSLVYDTNKNNEYDAERSAYLQSAFRVLKKPLGQPNAIGFQLYWAGNKDTKGGYFVDQGDGSKTVKNTATPGKANAGSGMVATGYINQIPNPRNTNESTTFTTTGKGKSGGTIIGQGSFNDGGPFHVGNKEDKHHKGKDADSNPINALHIWTGALFYKNQAEDGPLRFEDRYQAGSDQSIIVPVHLAWTGQDWAWWSTSFLYKPENPPPPYPPVIPYYPYPAYPTVPTPGTPIPYTPIPTGPPGVPAIPAIPTGVNPGINPGGTIPTAGGTIPTEGGVNPGYSPGGVASGGGTGGSPYFGGGDGDDGYSPTGQQTGEGSGGEGTGSSEYDEAGTGDDLTPGPNGEPIDSDTGQPYGGTPAGPSKGSGGGDGSGGGGGGGKPKGGYPVYQVPNVPIQLDIPFNPPSPQGTANMTMGNSSATATPNLVSIAGTFNTQAQAFQASNYASNAVANAAFNAAASAGATSKDNNTSPQTGGCGGFAAQGGTTPTGTTGSGSPFPPTSSGGQGDPFIYTASPKDQQMSPTTPKSKYKNGTANGGICYYPAETDLRDAATNGMTPPGVTLNEFLVMTAPKAYFGCGVPELANGSIKSGFRWGVDATNGDLVFQSIASSQTAVDSVRFTNTSQRIRWHSQRGTTSYGELAHFNTAARTWTFQDASGYVLCSDGNVGFYGTVPIAKVTVSGAKGGNAALASLLSALSSYGLITDTTTA